VVLDTSLLTRAERETACALVLDSGAHAVCTSAGLMVPSPEEVKALRECVGPRFIVKASGKIASVAAGRELIEAGADRLGTTDVESLLWDASLSSGAQGGSEAQV
jgi:deoxyribose-phosphate aldolase